MPDPMAQAFAEGFLKPKGRIYFDAAATSLMPRAVLAAQKRYYETACANPHTSAHGPGRSSTALVEAARAQVARLFGTTDATWATLFLGSGSTAALNRAAQAIYVPVAAQTQRRVVLVTGAEHHSNYLPWRRLAGPQNVHTVPLRPDGALDLAALAQMLERYRASINTLAVTAASNVTGAVTDVPRVAALARAFNVPLVLDAAQAAPHMPLAIPPGVSAVAISGHKLYAPGSPGVLLIRRSWLDLGGAPIGDTGGGTVESVSDAGVIYSDHAEAREEAGTPNVAGILALGLVAGILERVGMARLAAAEHALTAYLLDRLQRVPGLVIYGSAAPGGIPRLGVVSFNLSVPHAAVAAALDSYGLCLRNECFCAQPCVRALLTAQGESAAAVAARAEYERRVPGRPGMVRASLGPWNTTADVDALVEALRWAAANPDAVCDRCAPCGGGAYVFMDDKCSTTRPCFTLEEEIGRAAQSW